MTTPTTTPDPQSQIAIHLAVAGPRTMREILAACDLGQMTVATALGSLTEAGRVKKNEQGFWQLVKPKRKESRPLKSEGRPMPRRDHPASVAKLGKSHSRAPKDDLSPEQRREGVLRYVVEYIERNQYAPSVRDIVRELKMSSTSVVDYCLDRLVLDGLLVRDKLVSRTTQITAAGYRAAGKQPPVREVVVVARLCDGCGGCLPAVEQIGSYWLCWECRA